MPNLKKLDLKLHIFEENQHVWAIHELGATMESNLTTGPASFKSWNISFQKSKGRWLLRRRHHWVQPQHTVSSFTSEDIDSASVPLTSGGLTQAPFKPSIDTSEDWAGAISSVTVMTCGPRRCFFYFHPTVSKLHLYLPTCGNECNHSQLAQWKDDKLESSGLSLWINSRNMENDSNQTLVNATGV